LPVDLTGCQAAPRIAATFTPETPMAHRTRSSAARVLATHRDVLRKRIRKRMGRHVRRIADSEDIVDSAIRQALEGRTDSSVDGLEGWLWRAALNKLHDAGRRANRQRSYIEDGGPDPDETAASGRSPSSYARLSEQQDLLAQALARLKPEDELALRHYYVLGLRGHALGESLCMSASAAAHRVSRAWARLMKVARTSATRGR